MSNKKELKNVKVQWKEIEKLGVFNTTHLVIKVEDEEIGYYRIWHSPETDNIAFYGSKDKHGVMPPMEYQAKEEGYHMMKKIKDDLNQMGFDVCIDDDTITDYMLIGIQPFPKDLEAAY